MSEIVIYEDGDVSLEATVDRDTLWLSQKKMANLFDVDSDTISYHLKNIYKSFELDKGSTTEKISVVQKEGKREVQRSIEHYNLDAIISVGYRVNSKRATQFRIWATDVLKKYLLDGYTLNQKHLQQKGLKEFNQAVALLYIIKDHPFVDGNKRIGAFLFILFLQKNQMLHRANSEAKINDNALVALALMTAKSLPQQKDTVIALIVNMLVEEV
jgi:prophage maintenance system killer protein